MKKRCSVWEIIVLAVLLYGTAYAAVQVTLTVPDASVTAVLAAFNQLAGTHMTIEARGSSPNPAQDFDARWDFRIKPKDPNETNKMFADRFVKELVRANVRMVESAKESKRYRDAVGAVKPPDVNVPDAVIQ